MMEGYMGETKVSKFKSPFAQYQRIDFIREWINKYGSIDEGHHKQWLIDQIARIAFGTNIIIGLAQWESGEKEWRLSLGEPSEEYVQWAGDRIDDICGIAP